MSDIKTILVPVDGSEGAHHAAALAGDLARGIGARLKVLYVYDASSIAIMGMQVLDGKEIDDAIKRVSASYLETAKVAIGPGVDVELIHKMGHPLEEILALAKFNEVDLIVMGSRGQSSMKELLMGSVSHHVIQYAPCPVTVVR